MYIKSIKCANSSAFDAYVFKRTKKTTVLIHFYFVENTAFFDIFLLPKLKDNVPINSLQISYRKNDPYININGHTSYRYISGTLDYNTTSYWHNSKATVVPKLLLTDFEIRENFDLKDNILSIINEMINKFFVSSQFKAHHFRYMQKVSKRAELQHKRSLYEKKINGINEQIEHLK